MGNDCKQELVERRECLKSNLDLLNQRISRLKELAKFSESVNSKMAKPFEDDIKEDPSKEERISDGSIPELLTIGLAKIDEQIDRIGSSLESISNLIG